MPQPEPASLIFVVGDDDTALAVGSGSLPVLGTPRLLAWLEAATCACLDPVIPEGSTSVGTRAITRFARPVCYQGFPDAALPDELKEANPLGLWRLVDGEWAQR